MQLGLAMVITACLSRVQGSLGGAQFMVAIQYVIDDGPVQCLDFLIHVGDALAAGHLELALVGGQLAEQQLEQARLAGTVGAHDACLVAVVQGQVGILDQRLGPALQTELTQCNHA